MVSHSWLIYGHLHDAAEIGQDCRGLHLALSEKYTIYAPSPAVPRCSHLYQEGADQAARVRMCPQTFCVGLFASRGSWVRVPSSPPSLIRGNSRDWSPELPLVVTKW